MKQPGSQRFYPAALTIAGSDSGGGAGIQADLRTFNAFGVYACSAITALTAQNPLRVIRVDAVTPECVRAQIDAVLEAIPVKYAKTGMLFSAAIVDAVIEAVKKHQLKLVVDPVMVSTSGHKLLQDDAIERVREGLLPCAEWVTPNIPEAELLLGRSLRSEDDFLQAACDCSAKFGCHTLLKTGHAVGKRKGAIDYVCRRDGECFTLSGPLLADCRAGHGTGCTLSAALTALMALDLPWRRVLCEAKGFVYGSLSEAVSIGRGIEAMYPPEEEYADTMILAPVKASS